MGKGQRLKLARMLPFVQEVNEECESLATSILEDQDIPSREGATTLLLKRQEAFRARIPVREAHGAVVKLPSHRNAEQRELRAQIGSLQSALEKPLHRGALSLAAEESFHILDIREELALSKDTMLAAVTEGPWRLAIESSLEWKKQLLEDTTTKQIHQKKMPIINLKFIWGKYAQKR